MFRTVSKKSDILEETEDLFRVQKLKNNLKTKSEIKELKGIGGWLSFYTFFLFIGGIGLLLKSLIDFTSNFSIFIIEMFMLYVTVLLLYLLWKGKKLFRTLNIIIFSLYTIGSVGFLIVGLVGGFSTNAWVVIVLLFVHNVLWLSYFIKSKRVKTLCVN